MQYSSIQNLIHKIHIHPGTSKYGSIKTVCRIINFINIKCNKISKLNILILFEYFLFKMMYTYIISILKTYTCFQTFRIKVRKSNRISQKSNAKSRNIHVILRSS